MLRSTPAILDLIFFIACFSLWADQPHAFVTDEIRVEFGGAFSERAKPGTTVYGAGMAQPRATVDFCQWQPQPPEVQQVMRPDTGFLCELHIMPTQSESEILTLVERLARMKRRDHGQTFRVQSVVLHGHRVVRWRFQAGKTRLDHFMLIGKRQNYLFVSSPYGSNGAVEEILSRTIIQK